MHGHTYIKPEHSFENLKPRSVASDEESQAVFSAR